MDQELKQRLIGAAVITALAAIFVPMLFDDPIDETGKSINELKIPDMPAKAQDVEIMPLPEKAEDVATAAQVERPALPHSAQSSAIEEPADEADMEAPRPKARLTDKQTAIAAHKAQPLVADEDVAEAEDVASAPKTAEPIKATVKSVAAPIAAAPAVVATKPPKAVIKMPDAVSEAPIKPAVPAAASAPAPVGGDSATTRWYLNAGSFTQKANAQTLLDTLKQQGFAATLKEVSSDKGMVYKVRVGPMLDKIKAQAVKAKLAQININSFVSGDE